MLAAHTPTYGAPDVLELRPTASPTLGPCDVRIAVHASPITAGDRRIRSADFPSISAVPGRLMMGIFRPRHPVQGTMFAGRVVEVGHEVTRWSVGDDVFGAVDHGAYAEELVLPEEGAVAPRPEGLTASEAAALPYGAGTAWSFLTELAQLKAGERLLVLGASGGVGRYAVQIGRHLGAEVTAVCSAGQAAQVRAHGAHHVLDYRVDPPLQQGPYDVIFDIADATTFGRARRALSPTGRYATLSISLGVLWHMARTALTGGSRALFSVAMTSPEMLAALTELVRVGALRPQVVAELPLARIAEAHAMAETTHGEVVVVPTEGPPLRAVG